MAWASGFTRLAAEPSGPFRSAYAVCLTAWGSIWIWMSRANRWPVGHEYGEPIAIIGGVGFLTVRPLAGFLGLAVAVDNDMKTVALSRP